MTPKPRGPLEPARNLKGRASARPAPTLDAGTSLIELTLVLAVFGVLTAIALSLILQTYRSVQNRLGTSTLYDNGVTALSQMTREIRTAGYPSAKLFTTAAVVASPGIVATPFVTVTSYDLVFQADINGDGTVEQIEYVIPPLSQQLLRKITSINPDGSLAANTVTTLAVGNVQNQLQSQPLFTWDVDPAIQQPFPLNVRTVYINLDLQSSGYENSPRESMTLMATCPRMNF